jgi:hypothetical protein
VIFVITNLGANYRKNVTGQTEEGDSSKLAQLEKKIDRIALELLWGIQDGS